MTLKEKSKTYNFWISIVSAAVLIARIIGDKFNIFIDTTLIMDITTGLCSIFVILGILSAPKSTGSQQNNQEITALNNSSINNTENNTKSLKNDCETNNIESYTKSETGVSTLQNENLNLSLHIEPLEKTIETENNNKPQPIESLINEQPDNIIDNKNNDETNNVLYSENKEFKLIEIIEKLKADIQKANKIIEDNINK